MLMTGVMTGNIVVAHVTWQWARGKARAHAVPPSDVRVASLVTRDTSVPGGALFAAGPFAILLAAALLLYTYRDDVPDGPDTANPFGQLAFGAILVAMMLTMAVTMARRSRQIAVDGPAAAAEQRFRRVNVARPRSGRVHRCDSMSVMTVESIPAFGDTLSVNVVRACAAHAVRFRRELLDVPRRPGRPSRSRACCAAGGSRRCDTRPRVESRWLYYVNPHDPAMWVENRFGLGYTLNFGNWRAWLLIIGMMLVPMFAGRLLF